MNSSDLVCRRNHVSAFLNHCIVFLSGRGFENYDLLSLRSVCMYNPYTHRCLQYEIIGEMEIPRGRFGSCAVNIGKDIYMFGGSANTYDLNDVWKLSVNAESENQRNLIWEEIKVEPASATPSPRCEHSGWEYHGSMWIFGGWGLTPQEMMEPCLHDHGEFSDNEEGQNNQLLSFDPSIPQWTNHENRGAKPCPRMGAVAAVLGDTVWLFGGREDIERDLTDLYQLQMESLTWTKIQLIGPEPRFLYYHTLNPLFEQSLLLCGGPEPMVLSVLAPETVQLSVLTIRTDRCRYRTSHTATTVLSNSIVLFGGSINDSTLNDLDTIPFRPFTLLQYAIRAGYKRRGTLFLQDMPFKIKKLCYFPVTVNGQFKM